MFNFNEQPWVNRKGVIGYYNARGTNKTIGVTTQQI
jgi:hypothetical protein